MAITNTDVFPSFVSTTKEYYEALETKDQYTLYFLSDTGELYKGDVAYGKGGIKLSSLTDLPTENDGNIYYVAEQNGFYAYNAESGSYVMTIDLAQIAKDTVVVDDAIDPDSPSDTNAATSAAIVDYINNHVSVDAGSALTITTTADITVQNAIGLYEADDIITAGTSLQSIINNMFTNPIVYVDPSLSTSYSPNPPASVEVGAPISNITITPSYTKNDGGDITGVTIDKIVGGVTTNIYTGAAMPTDAVVASGLVVSDTANASIKVKVDHAAGSAESEIAAGSLVNTKSIGAFRYSFYTVDSDKDATLDNAAVIAMTKVQAKPGTINVTCTKDASRVVIAIPSNRSIKTIKSSNLGYDVTSTFTQSTMNVTNSLGTEGTEREYKVYTYTTEIPFPAQDVYVVTIS